jgi:branched-chain amino acid transport system substrate-binding protein
MTHANDDTTPAARLPSRRTFLKAVGAGGVAGGLAGCVSDIQGQAGGEGIGTVNYGILNPMTGPYGGLAVGQRQGSELAVAHVNDSDEFDFEIQASYDDTEADPSIGRRKAQKLVQQDGADYLFGAISSSTAIGLNEFAADEGVIYNPGAAAVSITGANCNEYVFRFETSTAQIAEATSAWTVDNLGTKVWVHIADYAYGDSVLEEMKPRMEAANDDVEIIGESRSELGASNFGNFISQISNSDADVAVLGMTGGDLINFVGQAANQGLKEAVDIMSPTMTFQVVRGALGPAAAGTYGGVRYIPRLETGDNRAFVSAYQDEYDAVPDNFARVGYDSIRMTARGIQEAGTADPAEVKDTLAGLEVPTIFGPNQFRECDHQATNPVWMGENVEGSGETTEVELLETIDGEDAIPPCSETGCSL